PRGPPGGGRRTGSVRPGDGGSRGSPLPPLRPPERGGPPWLRLLHRRQEPEGPRDLGQSEGRPDLLLASARPAGSHRGGRLADPRPGFRRLLADPASGKPAVRLGVSPEPAARLQGRSRPPGPRAAEAVRGGSGAAARVLEGVPDRAPVRRILDGRPPPPPP